jgi:hypothetical protein
MQAIWKFPLLIQDGQAVSMPAGAKVLCVQVQNGVPCLWALVDPTAPKLSRNFFTFGTGHPIDPTGLEFVGTYQIDGGALVFHVFTTTDH